MGSVGSTDGLCNHSLFVEAYLRAVAPDMHGLESRENACMVVIVSPAASTQLYISGISLQATPITMATTTTIMDLQVTLAMEDPRGTVLPTATIHIRVMHPQVCNGASNNLHHQLLYHALLGM